MPEISDAEYSELLRTQARFGQVRQQYRDLRRQHTELAATHDEAIASLERTVGERDQLRQGQADPEGRIAELTGKLRDVTHRQAFARLAGDRIAPEALDDAYQLSGYRPEADAPDEAALGELIEQVVSRRPYLARPAATEAPAPSAPDRKAPLNPGPGSERGGKVQAGGMTVKYSDLADGEYMRANQDRIQELAGQGLVTFVD